MLRFRRETNPVCPGPITVTEYGDLPFKALDGTVHIRFVQCAATVANQITGGEVVASVYNDVIIGNQTAGILPVEAKRVGVHFYITVQSPQSLGGTVYLKLSYFVLRIQYLALQVADTDRIIVRQTYCTYSCTCKVEGGRGTKSACAYYQNSCLMQFSCPPSPISGREICLLYRVMMRIINYEKGI